jgi:hypothetical protein
MRPRRGRVPASAQPPAPEGSTRTTRCQAAALATDNITAPPAAGGRVRVPRAGGRNTNPPQEDPQPLAPGPGALEPARGFAPLTGTHSSVHLSPEQFFYARVSVAPNSSQTQIRIRKPR